MTTPHRLAAVLILAAGCSGTGKTAETPRPDEADKPARPLAPVTDDDLVGAKVAAVTLRGLSRVGESRARLAIELRPGDSFDRAKIRASLHKLMTILGIADARAVAYRMPDGKIGVAFAITESPRIASISIAGNKSLAAGELLKLTTLAVGQPVDPSASQRAAVAMKARYSEAGFARAEVDWNANPQGAVVFTVREGERVSISKIDFGSTRALTSARLNNILLKTSPDNTVGGVYQAASFEAGLVAITSAYYDIGHINARVGPTSISYPTPETIAVTIPIDEGPQFRLGELTVAGKLAAPAKQYLRQVKIRRGQVFSRTAVREAMDRLSEFHKTKTSGKTPNVTPLTDVDLEKKKVDIKFEIDS